MSPQVAVVVDGYLLVRRGATPPRRLLRAAERPILCLDSTSFTGTWGSPLQMTRREMQTTDEDGSFVRPYRVESEASDGDHPAFQRWQRLQITFEVTSDTEVDPQDELEAALGLVPVTVTAHCEGDRFVADSIELEQVASGLP